MYSSDSSLSVYILFMVLHYFYQSMEFLKIFLQWIPFLINCQVFQLGLRTKFLHEKDNQALESTCSGLYWTFVVQKMSTGKTKPVKAQHFQTCWSHLECRSSLPKNTTPLTWSGLHMWKCPAEKGKAGTACASYRWHFLSAQSVWQDWRLPSQVTAWDAPQ